MQFVKGKSPEIHYATRPGARAKRRDVALGRPGFEPGRIPRMAEFRTIPKPDMKSEGSLSVKSCGPHNVAMCGFRRGPVAE
jgi:hypothetical protein